MTDVHSCSYHCDRPECIKSQRDELRERLAQPEQEPVAWMHPDWRTYTRAPAVSITLKEGWHPLYTTPPQRKPLTDNELADLWYKQSLDWMEFARAIEAAHGIKGS